MKREGLKGPTRTTVYRVLRKWDEYQTVGDLTDPPKERKGVTHDVCDFVDSEMEKND